jgi:hypothetical protein
MNMLVWVGLATISLSTSAMATGQDLICGLRWGASAKSLVTTAEAARAIFIAVERDFSPHVDKAEFPVVEASDEGRWWSVARGKPVSEHYRGGGQLSMRIDKCDGRIWHLFRTR